MSLLLSNPPAIVIVNDDITAQIQGVLVRQLRIDQVMDGYTFDQTIADNVSILYGGSVKPGNAEEIFSKPDVDGGLIGGAALVADDFFAIIKAI